MTADAWMLYGANGYTGALIAEEAARRGERPILAGRREDAVRPLAERLGLPWRVFPLEAPDEIARQLEGVAAVLLCAGPFSVTSAPVVQACLAAGVHYLDITGELSVFEACHGRDAEAQARRVVVMPGVGFDVVPSDCLALALAEALPGAKRLELGIAAIGQPSRGTAKTMLEGLAEGGAIRRDGRIVRVPHGWRSMEVPFRDHPRRTVSAPWGDVSTAWYSTRIPDIVVYMSLPRAQVTLARPLGVLMRAKPLRRLAAALVERTVAGPDAAERERGRSQLWGRVTDAAGRSVEGTLVTPEGYALTVTAALECTRRVAGGEVRPGALTPAMAFGSRFVTELPGCDLRVGG